MVEPLAIKLNRLIETVSSFYHRLVLLIGPSGTGKTVILQQISTIIGIPATNLNLELSKALLEMTPRQRTLQTPKIIDDIASSTGNTTIFDNTEVLFDVQIQQDPLRLLKGLSRSRTVIASWNGVVKSKKLVYAEPGHPEFKSYDIDDLVYICTNDCEINTVDNSYPIRTGI